MCVRESECAIASVRVHTSAGFPIESECKNLRGEPTQTDTVYQSLYAQYTVAQLLLLRW